MRIGRAITQFTKIMKTVKKPMTLAGASNYLAWSKAILKVARQVGVEKIILERQETSPRPEHLKISQYWNVQNNWLHSLINSTISAQAREHFKESDSLSAYKLWEAVRTAFQERPEIQRESLLTELVRMTPQSAGSERNYIERFLAIRGEFERLGFKQLDHTLHDILKMNITSRWREFIQNRFDMACQSGTNLPEKDLEGLLKDILHRIPKKDQKKGGSTKPNTNATSSDPQKSYKNMNGAPISWRSQRQTSVSKSTTEAEYLAASEAACELVWINDLLIDTGVISEGSAKLRSSKLSVDNKGAVDLAKAEAITRRARHIEIRHHMLRDWVQKDEISIEHVGTDANKADGLTKALAMDPYAQFVSAIGVTS
ncbi:copia-like retrotransposon family protein [Coccidioides posadasii C735 delta SOWgp]|uniref:Copia-like retrotransposon family protein n=1 Tax=Coccidioides posadasii (strain C735) TaxID=222929 RepID=C5P3I0_COCP7|nr:copia-like retrotransposon family protein [Coccidioides posadasii C735 delta SOWgp]EER28248.1 copia-like retrotransposon family protein [Coccidioides posadasii C735 delta SOWgp]|eukprot:XP_003070393.1 copia-like retrotransposon family protein [Coccidioides posadasii C735 delta SOWgp]